MLAYRLGQQRGIVLAILATVLALASTQAVAHVKWFCGPIDVKAPPVGLATVLSTMFLSRAGAFTALVGVGYLVDGFLAGRRSRSLWQSPRLEIVEGLLIRLGVGGYAVCLWDKTAVVPWGAGAENAILTPELLDQDHWVGMLQLAVAFMLVFRRTCPLAALGLAVLYGVGVARYGVFHMTDYVYFLGLTGYLAVSAPPLNRRPRFRNGRVPLIAGSLGFSLMWTAIEKFLYPAWTARVLVAHPNLTAGFPIPFVVVTAGFVEFSLAFYLLVGRSLLRINAAILMLVFVAAIPEFGELDRVGHLPIIAILLVVIIHGPTRLQEATRQRGAGPIRSAVAVAGLYVVSMAAMMGIYYGLQQTDAWR